MTYMSHMDIGVLQPDGVSVSYHPQGRTCSTSWAHRYPKYRMLDRYVQPSRGRSSGDDFLSGYRVGLCAGEAYPTSKLVRSRAAQEVVKPLVSSAAMVGDDSSSWPGLSDL